MTVSILDNSHVLSSGHVAEINAAGSRYPFDLKVITDNFPNRAAMDAAAHNCVSAPNVVCAVVDPVHHSTVAHFGTTTGVKGSDFNMIAAAGNSSFKTGDYGKGIVSIADRALESSVSAKNGTTVVVQPAKQPIVAKADNTAMYWTIGIFLAICAGVAYWFWRQNKKDNEEFKARLDNDMNTFREEANVYRTRNIEEEDFHQKLKASVNSGATKPAAKKTTYSPPAQAYTPSTYTPPSPVYVAPQPATVVVERGGAGDFTTGYLIGSLSHHDHHDHHVHHETVVHHHREESSYSPPPSDRKPSYSSSSDWSSSSSSDSGGSSSDWGSSSSSSDWGSSGGSDFGGGGSDW